MIGTKIPSGKTLFKMVLKKFPAGTKTGDELFKYRRIALLSQQASTEATHNTEAH
jgi:hypothetical protein